MSVAGLPRSSTVRNHSCFTTPSAREPQKRTDTPQAAAVLAVHGVIRLRVQDLRTKWVRVVSGLTLLLDAGGDVGDRRTGQLAAVGELGGPRTWETTQSLR